MLTPTPITTASISIIERTAGRPNATWKAFRVTSR